MWYYYITTCHSKQLPSGGFNGAFWWYGPLSEDREKFEQIYQNYLVALMVISHDGKMSFQYTLLYKISAYRCVPGRRTWTHAQGRKTDNVKTLLVPSRRMWTIKLPQFNNPITIVNTIAGYILRPNLAWYEIQTNKTYKW